MITDPDLLDAHEQMREADKRLWSTDREFARSLGIEKPQSEASVREYLDAGGHYLNPIIIRKGVDWMASQVSLLLAMDATTPPWEWIAAGTVSVEPKDYGFFVPETEVRYRTSGRAKSVVITDDSQSRIYMVTTMDKHEPVEAGELRKVVAFSWEIMEPKHG